MNAHSYSTDVYLRWGDMDAFGHVNNVQFARILEEARVRGFREWFAREDGQHFPPMFVARFEIDYLAQLKYRIEPIQVVMSVSKVSGASFVVGYEVTDGATIFARAETTLVTVDLETGRPKRIDDRMRAELSQFLADPLPMRRRG